MIINKKILRYHDRDIILVELDNKQEQPMYRSTGRSSGMPGTWLPFDGITYSGRWFDKRKYVTTNPDVLPKLERFGTQEIKELSDQLGQIDIAIGEEASWYAINDFLSYSPK